VNNVSPLVVNMKGMEQHAQMIRVHLWQPVHAASAMVLFATQSQSRTAKRLADCLMELTLLVQMILVFQQLLGLAVSKSCVRG
jgi:hypothetical protein